MIKIKLAKHAGFCFGVKRAVNLALKTASENKTKKIATLGPLIHNPQVTRELAGKGIIDIANPQKVRSGIVIVCSHGMHPLVLNKLKKKKITIVDATCPFVRKIEKIVKKLKKEDYAIVIIGDQEHPEVKAITGYAGKKVILIESVEAARKLSGLKKIGVVAQTTQSVEKYKLICRELKKKTKHLKIFNTICDATQKRQEEAVCLSREVEKMIVIGGYNSANTKRLAKLCLELGRPTRHIEQAKDLDPAFLKNTNSVGILAGASTPDWIINNVIARIKQTEES
ncbi:MAG: 4-hydroxy-3-methylbut-2-enyl diphosphate reductase [bacterium]|nr:4-hydroxy-3-methylbut-2-enyl diphosphate reductase [bacterium]